MGVETADTMVHLRFLCASVSVCERVRGVSADGRRDLGRWPSGLSPYGVSSFCTLGWGRRVTRVEWSSIYPVLVLQPVTGALEGDLGGLAAAVYPTGLCLSPCLLSLGAPDLPNSLLEGTRAFIMEQFLLQPPLFLEEYHFQY